MPGPGSFLPRPKRMRKGFWVPALWLLISFFSFSPSAAGQEGHLLVRNTASEEILFRFPVSQGQRFTIRYIHSVDLSPVWEDFSAWAQAGIVLERTCFFMFGAGMGHWEGRGRITGDENGRICIEEMHQPLGSFLLRVGLPGVDHTLMIGEHKIHLSELIPGERVELCVSFP